MKKKVLQFTLASYIVVTLVPLVIFGIFLFGSINRFYSDEIVSNRINMLQMVRNDFDGLIDEMNTNALQMLASNEFSTSYLQNAYGNMYDVNRQLLTVHMTSGDLYDVLYYNTDMEQIYTTETAFSYERFSQYSKSAPLESMGNPETVYLQNSYTYWIPSYRTERNDGTSVFGYVVTSKRSMHIPTRSITYIIQTATLDKIFGDYIDRMNACIMLLDDQGNAIYKYDGSLPDTARTAYMQSGFSFDTLTYYSADGLDYAAYQARSEESNLIYAVLIPYETIVRPLQTQMHAAIMVYIAAFLIGGTSIVIFTRKSYAPVRAVSSLAMNTLEKTYSNMNEMELAQEALLVMQRERQIRRQEKELIANLNNPGEYEKNKEGQNSLLIVLHITQNTGDILDVDDYREYAAFVRDNCPKGMSLMTAAIASKSVVCIIANGSQCEISAIGVYLQQIKNLLEYTFGVVTKHGTSELKDKSLREAFEDAETKAMGTENRVNNGQKEPESGWSFYNVMQYILNNYNRPEFSAKALASDMGMSLSNFSHYFRNNTGRKFSTYLSLLRMERAKKLLRTTDFSLGDIAGQCGYLDASAFMRNFKNKTGITPTTYRNTYRD